jgi:hypothetical protein
MRRLGTADRVGPGVISSEEVDERFFRSGFRLSQKVEVTVLSFAFRERIVVHHLP